MIMVAVSAVAIFSFAVLAIDMSLIQLAKNQLQNAADAAALSAAIEYGITNGDEAASTNEAISMAGLNRAMQTTQQPVVITPDDVSYPGSDRVRVRTHRTIATADPVRLYFMRVITADHSNRGNVQAVATAALTPVGSTSCLRPWMIPDRWDDADNDSLWDPGELYDPNTTGYRVPQDVGRSITLKYQSAGETPKMGWYQPIRFGPVNRGGPDCAGADCYRTFISECEPYPVTVGDTMELEMGNMVGPTRQGWSELFARDPGAYFNTSTGTIENSAHEVSPRLIKIAMYDPTAGIISSGSTGSSKYTVVTKIAYLFIEAPPESGISMPVTARFVRYASSGDPCPSCPEGFLFTARLVE